MPVVVQAEVRKTAVWAEKIRSHLGEPMRINSWYRCPVYNKRIGGAPKSQHILGKAIDFVVRRRSPRQVQALIRKDLWSGWVKGLGRYPGFTHIDRRSGVPQIWG